MSKNIKNFTHLQNAIDDYLHVAVNHVANQIHTEIQNFIQEYYDEYDPNRYQRTFQFLNSITQTSPKKITNGYQIEIYIDTTITYKNNWTMEGTAIQANAGLHGWHNEYQSQKGSHFWDDSLNAIEDTKLIANQFTEYLRSKGFTVHVIA